MTSDTRTYGRAFSSGAAITCFNDYGLSRPGIEPLESRVGWVITQHVCMIRHLAILNILGQLLCDIKAGINKHG